MNVLQGVHKHWWQGLAIVLSSLSAGMTRRDLYINTPHTNL